MEKRLQKIKRQNIKRCKKIEQEYNKIPGLAVVLVGNDPASEVYVRNKGIQTKEVGMTSYEFKTRRHSRKRVIGKSRRIE